MSIGFIRSHLRGLYCKHRKYEWRNYILLDGRNEASTITITRRKTSEVIKRDVIDKSIIIQDLITVADYYRFALTQFLSVPLSYGHSTVSAQDDASFLILQSLKLPVEEGIEQWGPCRLVKHEREQLVSFIERRVKER